MSKDLVAVVRRAGFLVIRTEWAIVGNAQVNKPRDRG
jgi:hypothetical protein